MSTKIYNVYKIKGKNIIQLLPIFIKIAPTIHFNIKEN